MTKEQPRYTLDENYRAGLDFVGRYKQWDCWVNGRYDQLEVCYEHNGTRFYAPLNLDDNAYLQWAIDMHAHRDPTYLVDALVYGRDVLSGKNALDDPSVSPYAKARA